MTHPLTISDVSVAFGADRVLHSVSLEMEEGESFGLIGLNGAGKTTLIRSMLGLIRTEKGSVSLFGESGAPPAARRHLAYLPEQYRPSGALTGWEHLSLALSFFSAPLDRDRAKVIAEEIDLRPEVLNRPVSTYSKGMGQKLGLIGTLLTDVPLLVLDEPMSGLDPLARVRLKDALFKRRDEGKSVFFSSHILADVAEICTRIGILHEGRLVYADTPDALLKDKGTLSLERAFLETIGKG